MQNEGQKEELTYFAASNEWLEKSKQIYGVSEKDCVEKLMKFPQQQYKHWLHDYQSCSKIRSYKTY